MYHHVESSRQTKMFRGLAVCLKPASLHNPCVHHCGHKTLPRLVEALSQAPVTDPCLHHIRVIAILENGVCKPASHELQGAEDSQPSPHTGGCTKHCAQSCAAGTSPPQPHPCSARHCVHVAASAPSLRSVCVWSASLHYGSSGRAISQ